MAECGIGRTVSASTDVADGFALRAWSGSALNCGQDVVILPTAGHDQMDVLGSSRHEFGTQHHPKNLLIP